MKVSKYTRLGILIVISMTILVWGLSYLKGNDLFSKSVSYHVVYNRVEGLVESNKVTLNGYQIGQVRSIAFNPDNSGSLIVTLTIDAEVKIPVNSVAKIVSSDIMGTRSINMVFSNETDYYQASDTIPGAAESDLKEQVSMQVLPIKNKAEQLLGTIDSAITILTVIFNEDARQNLVESFESFNKTMEQLESTSANLEEILATRKGNVNQIILNLEELTETFRANTDELENTLQNLSSFSDTLSEISVTPLLNNLAEASKQIVVTLERLNSTESTAGLLLNDDKLHQSIIDLTANLNFLISDIQANPKRYLQFSAIDLGKEYYISANTEENQKDIIFKVHLVSSENQIPLESKFFEGIANVEEIVSNNVYSYLTGSTGSYNEITKIHNSVRPKFPKSTIVAFKKGRLIKLEKALKSLQ